MSTKGDSNLEADKNLDGIMSFWQSKLDGKYYLSWLKKEKPYGYCLIYSPIVDGILSERLTLRANTIKEMHDMLFKKKS